VKARRFVIATGSSPAIPPIPGLNEVRYLTNETIFDLTECPEHLVVIGGGPIGCELAQAHRRLGARVTIIEAARMLANEDPELAGVVINRLRADGVAIIEGAKVERVAPNVTVHTSAGAIDGSHLLVATGRRANVAALDLDKAGVAHTQRGVTVDRSLRSSNPRIYAIGDAAGGLQFTHLAAHHAGIVIRSALFRLPARADALPVPRVTYTAPELAQVGLTEQQAREKHADIRILRWPFADNDRARTERDVDGFVKLIADPRGTVLGAGIAGPHAGELIQSWIMPVARRMKLKAIAGLILPYPTLGEAGKRAATSFYVPKLLNPRTKRLVRFLTRLPILG
jgi:pyruvate/2-oxoglutarate dehydrogenase complex dihydrolipoamide dehydrogenase (E3) component